MFEFFSSIGGKLAGVGVVILAVVTLLWRVLAGAKQAGVDKQKAKEAEAREQVLERIRAAQEAGRAARAGNDDGMPDPFDRDNRG